MFINRIIRAILKFINLSEDGRADYICGGEALPSPLSQTEEAEMLKKLASGDKDARKSLIERNLRLVVYIAKRFENSPADLEDLISVGTIGLIRSGQFPMIPIRISSSRLTPAGV